MAKSVKKPVVKDKKSKTYWRQIRSRQRQAVRQFKPTTETLIATYDTDQEEWIPEIIDDWVFNYMDLEIPKEKEIVNDYDYCDYVFDERFYEPSKFYTYETHLANKEKFKRK